MTLAEELGQRISSLRFEEIPAGVIQWARVGILDTIGVTVAGSSPLNESSRIVERVLGPSTGHSLVFGTKRRTSALDAALINGTAAHALDFDDCSNTMCGHPSVPVLPALFAIADERGASGAEFLTAYVAGVETECKIAIGAGLSQYTHGWHPTSTLGVFGAAAASARLLKLDAAHTTTALAIAASLASGIKANFGSMTKPLHVGHCARNGLMAALLAAEGFTARHDAFEHPQGYLELYNGAGNFDLTAIAQAWGEPWDLERPALAIKQYPCCASTHPAIDAMIDLARTHALEADNVARIEVWIHERRLRHTNRPDPRSALDAKFSVQYCLARALADGGVRIEHFEGEAFMEERVRTILPRVTAAAYDTQQFPAENHFAGEVRVTTTDGRMLTSRVDQALGRSYERPLPHAQLVEKFDACIARIIAKEAGSAIQQHIENLERLADIREVTRLLQNGIRSLQLAANTP